MQVETQHIQLAASDAVRQVLTEGRNLDQVMEEMTPGTSGWAPAQRSALRDLSAGTLRHYGRLRTIMDLLLHKPLKDERLRYLLLVALYQLQRGISAPHAVVDHAVRATRSLGPHLSGVTNGVLRNYLRNQARLTEQAAQTPEGRYSHPSWWIDELRTQYGEQSHETLEAGNSLPPMTLRINRRRCTMERYEALLGQLDISSRRIAPEALQLKAPVPVGRLPGFFEGLVSVQDAGAQFAAVLLDAQDGMRVLDACAAPGGKTTHILELVNVEMVAVDVNEARLHRVDENLQRLGLTAELVTGDAAQPAAWWDGRPFQRILVDAPCSASGVVRRHPDIKWLRRHSDIPKFAEQQLIMLKAMWQLLEHGGKLLYATCSVFHQENERVIMMFLSLHPDARQLETSLPDGFNGQLLPNKQHDGFYYALLQKLMA